MSVIRLGLIGIGHVAEAQIEALRQVDSVKLVAAYDIDTSKRKCLPEDVIFFGSLTSFLDSEGIDLILVSTPNLTHASVGEQVLRAGCPLMLEKPASQDREELERLRDTALRFGVYFSVALHAAYAREVVWWKDQAAYDLGPLTGFDCGFYDPYISNGRVIGAAAGLGGSWFDSGINALSVIGLFVTPQNVSLQDSHMTRLESLECDQVQGSAIFSFPFGGKGIGRGFIDTNWALGLNRKVTRLFYDTTGYEVTLHHSKEYLRVERYGEIQFEKEFLDGNARLANHYVGLFEDLAVRFRSNSSNIEYVDTIHQLLFDAEMGNVLRETG